MSFQLTSKAFKDGGMIPAQYTADGDGVSPPLEWQGPPPGTKSFALICDDADGPGGTFTHWLAYNIPPNLFHFAEAYPILKTQPNGIKQGTNDFGTVGYRGPAPPSGVHFYCFKIYALSGLLDLEEGAKRGPLEKAIQRCFLREAMLVGKYKRNN